MKELQEKVKAILSEIENNFKDEKDIEFAKTKVLELYEVFADELEELEAVCSDKIDIISAKYSVLEEKMNEVQERIDRIQKDFYVEDEEYDLDIVCPYCDAEFNIYVDDELKKSVICPECNNVIELDWNDEEESSCGHGCSGCHHDCSHDEDDEEQDDEDM